MQPAVTMLDVVRHLYDAATDIQKWPVFLKCLADCFDADGSHLYHFDPQVEQLTFSALHGYDDFILNQFGDGEGSLAVAMERYQRRFAELMPSDPRISEIASYPGRPMSCRLVFDDATLRESDMYREISDPADVEYTLAVSTPHEGGVTTAMGVFRGKAGRAFTQAEVAAFSELIPHLRQAIRLQKQFALLDFGKRAAFEALDRLPLGVILTDGDAQIRHANASALHVLDEGDGFLRSGAGLTVANADERAELHGTIRELVRSARCGNTLPGRAMAVSRPSGREAFPVVVSPLWGNHLRFGLGRLDEPLASLCVTIPELPQEAPAELLQRLYGLTMAEARLVEALVGGRSLTDAARAFGISKHTARRHLYSAFAKTGTRSQAALIA